MGKEKCDLGSHFLTIDSLIVIRCVDFVVSLMDPARDLRTLPNVVMTPHLAGNTRESCRRVAERVMTNLRLAVKGDFGRMDLVE